jgi:hypothetical protein
MKNNATAPLPDPTIMTQPTNHHLEEGNNDSLFCLSRHCCTLDLYPDMRWVAVARRNGHSEAE